MKFYYILVVIIVALVFIINSVLNTKDSMTRITRILLELWDIELSIKETRILLAIIGILIILFCGLISLNIPSIVVCILGIISGLLILCAGVFNIKVILTLVLIPNLWLSTYNNKILRVIVSILGCTILIASISGIFAIKL